MNFNYDIVIKPIFNDYSTDNAIDNTINYIFRNKNTNRHGYWGIYPMTPDNAIKEFRNTRNILSDNAAEIRVLHFVVCFSFRFNIMTVQQYATLISQIFYNKYQLCYAIHKKSHGFHIHYIVSTTSYKPNISPLIANEALLYLERVKQIFEKTGRTILIESQ